LAQSKFQVWLHSWGINGYNPNQVWYKHFIHTFKYVKRFPMKIYQNCFRKETGADQCYQNSHFYEILKPQVLLLLIILYFAAFHLTIGRLQSQFWRNTLHIATNMHANTSYIFETLRLSVQEHCVPNIYHRKKILP
jgi:hypothetical protein